MGEDFVHWYAAQRFEGGLSTGGMQLTQAHLGHRACYQWDRSSQSFRDITLLWVSAITTLYLRRIYPLSERLLQVARTCFASSVP